MVGNSLADVVDFERNPRGAEFGDYGILYVRHRLDAEPGALRGRSAGANSRNPADLINCPYQHRAPSRGAPATARRGPLGRGDTRPGKVRGYLSGLVISSDTVP